MKYNYLLFIADAFFRAKVNLLMGGFEGWEFQQVGVFGERKEPSVGIGFVPQLGEEDIGEVLALRAQVGPDEVLFRG